MGQVIQIKVDRFSTIRKIDPRGTGGAYVMPEYAEDANRGAPQVDPMSHRLIEEQQYQAEPDPSRLSEIDNSSQVPHDAIPERGAKNLLSVHHKVRMFKCKHCGVKSEDRQLLQKHVNICAKVNEA